MSESPVELARVRKAFMKGIVTMSLSCTVSEIFNVEYWRHLEFWVRSHPRSLKMVPFNISRTSSHWRSIVTGPILFRSLNKARSCSKIAIFSYPTYIRRIMENESSLGILPQRLVQKNGMLGLQDSEKSLRLC